MNNTNTLSVAKEILEQLGGQKFIVMTGANNLVGGENTLSFKIGRNDAKVTHVRITLNGLDLYDVEYLYIRSMKSRVVASDSNVYADNLRASFESNTGMYTSMGSMGR